MNKLTVIRLNTFLEVKKKWYKAFHAISALLMLCCSTNGMAQQDSCAFYIQGKVLDIETKEPIAHVSIKVKDTDKFALTNVDGTFFIKGLCHEQNTFIISSFDYCDTVCEQHHQHGKVPHIYLTQKVLKLGTVIITAEKRKEEGTVTVSQTTLKKEEINSNPTQSLAAALSKKAGITLVSTGSNIQLPVIHGLYGNRILILNNGLKHGFQNWGTDHGAEIEVSSAHTITVLKGAAGVRFGPEALGGAIIIEPNPLYLKEPFFANIGTGYQTNGRGGFSTLEVGKGAEKWAYSVGGSLSKIGDRHAPDYSLTNSGKEEKSMNAGVRFCVKDWDFKVYYNYIDQNLALLRSSVAESGNAFEKAINSNTPIIINPFSYKINKPNQLAQHHLGKVEIDWWYSDNARLTFLAGRQLNKRKEYDVRRNADKPIINLDLVTGDYQLEWKHPDWKKLDGLVGLQIFTQNNDNNPNTGTTPFIPNYNTLRYSGFVIESLKKDNHTLEAGVRIDYENNNVRGRETNQEIFRDEYRFTNFTFSLGYIRNVSENATFRTNLGTAWRTANMSELYSFGQHGFKISYGLLRYYTNENGSLATDKVFKINESTFSPEKGFKWINEWRTQKRTNTYSLTAYTHFIQNYIFDRPVAVIGTIRGPMPVFIFDQADALFIGADFTWQKSWTEHLSGNYSVSYLWSRNIKKNEPLINQPPITTSYKIGWNTKDFWKINSSEIIIKPSYTFKQFQAPRSVLPDELINGLVTITPSSEIFDFKDAPAGYFLLDFSWSFQVKNFKGNIALQNILNTRYRNYLNQMRYFSDEPGRNILFTINYLINKK